MGFTFRAKKTRSVRHPIVGNAALPLVRLVCTALVCVALVPVLAAEKDDTRTLDSVLVVGTRVPMGSREGSDSASIVTREEIDRMAAASGVDLFRQLPGLQIDQMGGPGGGSFAYIRGSDPNHVLVLIDGVRMNDPTNSRGGGFDISNLDPNQIERVEVLRGSASSIYGADAMGGVINVVTRTRDPGIVGKVGIGGLGYKSLSARASTSNEAFRFSAAASSLRDGTDFGAGKLELTQLSAAAGFEINSSAKVEVQLRNSERKSSAFPDDSGGIQFAHRRALEQHHAKDSSMSAHGRWDAANVSVNAAATAFVRIEDIDSPGVAPGPRSDFGVPSSLSHTEYHRSSVLLNAIRHLPDSNEISIGVEVQRENGVSDSRYTIFGASTPADFSLQRDTRSGFAELKWLPAQDLIVRMGLRHDSVDGSGSRTSPNLGARYNFPDLQSSVKINYSEGFKPPSFFAMGLPIPLGGNPYLRPESNKNASIGYEQVFWGGRANASIVAFDSRYSDLVTFDNQINQLVNANRVNIQGAELDLSVKVNGSLRLRGVFTRMLSHVVDNNEPLRQRPGQRMGVQLDWAVNERSSLNWRIEYSADTFDSSIPTGNLTLPSNVRNDVSYVMRVQKSISLSAAIDNVFDRDNQSYIGALAPRRRFRLNVSAVF